MAGLLGATYRKSNGALGAARARGRTGGRRPKLTPDQAHHAQHLYDAGDHTVQRIADLLQVPRSTIYGHLNKTSIGRRPTGLA
ncbi:helix-turn-helix domain-containing protein [Pseudarthrobacter sp. S9]|uniref:helix-turn-helix domain-containing protein n=1 Tax=Pseudarthrobacter sp. S9 TaxID=3418421 RepID=UPI003D0217F4